MIVLFIADLSISLPPQREETSQARYLYALPFAAALP